MSRRGEDQGPVLIGFARAEEGGERPALRGAEGYPPFNLEARPDGRIDIVIAVAGFTIDELEVALIGESLLSVAGRAAGAPEPGEMLHRGIAKRRFRRDYALGPGLEVAGASLSRGLLRIALRRATPAPPLRKIKIDLTS